MIIASASVTFLMAVAVAARVADAYINLAKDVECGLTSARGDKIVGGEEVDRGQFPFMVSLRHSKKDRHYCGGAILDNTHIVTAAHCVERGLDKYVQVAVREHNVHAEERVLDAYRLRPSKVILHEMFDSVRLNHDLAIIKVSEGTLQWDNFTSPVCLGDPSGSDESVGTQATILGWGRISEGGAKPDILRKVVVPIMENSDCRAKLGKWFDIHGGQMCAGYATGQRDACQGDSGGPMIMKKNGRFVLIGVVSAGVGCARPELPGVYTRVSQYMDWIKDQLLNK